MRYDTNIVTYAMLPRVFGGFEFTDMNHMHINYISGYATPIMVIYGI